MHLLPLLITAATVRCGRTFGNFFFGLNAKKIVELKCDNYNSKKDSCYKQSAVVIWCLVGDWSVVGGVGGDDSVRVHHVLTGQVGLTHLSQAEWRERWSQRGNTHTRDWIWYVSVHAHCFLQVMWKQRRCEIPLQLCEGQLSGSSLLSHHGGGLIPLHKQTCTSSTQVCLIA